MMKHEYESAIEQCEQSIERDATYVKAYQRLSKCELNLLRLNAAYKTAQNAVEFAQEQGETGLIESSKEVLKLVESVQTEVQSVLKHIGDKQDLDTLLDHHVGSNVDQDSMEVEGLSTQYASIGCNFIYNWNPALLSSSELAEVDGMLSTLQDQLPDSLIVAQMRGKSHAQRGLYETAAKTMASWHTLFPSDPCVLYIMGLMERLNKLEKAQQYLEEALENADNINRDKEGDVSVSTIADALKDTRDYVALKQEGNTLFAGKKYEQAADKYTSLINRQLNAIVLSNRAQCYMHLGEHDVAIEDLEQGLTVNPAFTKSLIRKAECLHKLGDLEAAKSDYKMAMYQDKSFEDTVQRALFALEREIKISNGEKVVDLDFKEEVEIEDTEEFDEIMNNAGPTLVVIDFSASWCGPCKFIGPVYAEMAKNYAGKAIFLKVDVDESPDIAARYGVRSMPTFAFCKYGKLLDKFSGADQNTLASMVNRFL
eukprot:TRINITY_DN22151_c0_g1_i1.p1 TRINITY_DN22151_c0_g1~~TRINITY_DN22151_c0_g1_i1.p1  ORF type:complete len:483 (-),score=180.75 TRINITY_DN22151_c0_g1_i1:217-1665(-)